MQVAATCYARTLKALYSATFIYYPSLSQKGGIRRWGFVNCVRREYGIIYTLATLLFETCNDQYMNYVFHPPEEATVKSQAFKYCIRLPIVRCQLVSVMKEGSVRRLGVPALLATL